jgi:hypothetical protein
VVRLIRCDFHGGITLNSSGYVPKRRGVLEHLNDGRLTLQQYGAYDVLILLADKATGVWFGSAKALAANCGAGDIAERQARHILESLESKGYIKRFPKRRAHGNYPIAIDKYQVTVGAHSRMRLNARASSDWKTPVYDKCEVPGEEPGLQHGVAGAPIQEGEEEKRRRKKGTAASQPADPRHKPFVDFAFRSFEAKHGQKPNWDGKDFRNLASLLKRNQTLTSAELERRWQNYSSSTEPFTQKQGESLAYFCAKFDSFIDGPILRSTGGKPDARDIEARNKAAAGFPT